MTQILRSSPRRVARIAGALYLVTIVAGIFAEGFVSRSLIVQGDAAKTAANILLHRGLFQLGFAVYLVEMASQIATTALFYRLLRPVNGTLAFVAAFISLSGCIIKTISRLFFIAPLLVLGGAPYLNVFSASQLQAVALLCLNLNIQGTAIAMVFFGFSTPLHGLLILRSTFLPRILGVPGIVAGCGWLTFLYPPLGYQLFGYVAAIGLLGALAQITWLIVFGVDEERWRQQAAAGGVSGAAA